MGRPEPLEKIDALKAPPTWSRLRPVISFWIDICAAGITYPLSFRNTAHQHLQTFKLSRVRLLQAPCLFIFKFPNISAW